MSRRIKPHKVKGRELEEVREADPDGRPVLHHRTVDTLGKMLRAGTITPEMHNAAKDLEAAFILANLDPLRAVPILRVPGTGREPSAALWKRRPIATRCGRSPNAAMPGRSMAALRRGRWQRPADGRGRARRPHRSVRLRHDGIDRD